MKEQNPNIKDIRNLSTMELTYIAETDKGGSFFYNYYAIHKM